MEPHELGPITLSESVERHLKTLLRIMEFVQDKLQYSEEYIRSNLCLPNFSRNLHMMRYMFADQDILEQNYVEILDAMRDILACSPQSTSNPEYLESIRNLRGIIQECLVRGYVRLYYKYAPKAYGVARSIASNVPYVMGDFAFPVIDKQTGAVMNIDKRILLTIEDLFKIKRLNCYIGQDQAVINRVFKLSPERAKLAKAILKYEHRNHILENNSLLRYSSGVFKIEWLQKRKHIPIRNLNKVDYEEITKQMLARFFYLMSTYSPFGKENIQVTEFDMFLDPETHVWAASYPEYIHIKSRGLQEPILN